MAFLLRVFSRGREAPRDVEELREEFRLQKDEVSRVLLHNAEVRNLLETIFDESDEATKLFLSSPSYSLLRENEEVVSRILSGLKGALLFGRLSSAVEEHGVESVSDIVIRVLKPLSSLLADKHIHLSDDLPESLDFAWQLGSPLSGKAKVHFNTRQQSISRQEVRVRHPFQVDDDDRIERIGHYMEQAPPQLSSNTKDKFLELEQKQKQQEGIEAQATQASSVKEFVAARVQQGSADKEQSSDRDPSGLEAIMRVGANGSKRFDSRASSVNNSRRISYAGSELYTTDSDDDSLSTWSRTSLLVAVSEAQDDSDSSSGGESGDGGSDVLIVEEVVTVEPVDVVCDSASQSEIQAGHPIKQADVLFPSEHLSMEEHSKDTGDDFAEDKLPICSSVVLSRGDSCSENDLSQESFYAPEMWTYSEDKDANEYEAESDDRSLLKNLISMSDTLQKGVEEVVKVILSSGCEDAYVSVSVHPVPVMSAEDAANSFNQQEQDCELNDIGTMLVLEAPEKSSVREEYTEAEKHQETEASDLECQRDVDKKSAGIEGTGLENKQEPSPTDGTTVASQSNSVEKQAEEWSDSHAGQTHSDSGDAFEKQVEETERQGEAWSGVSRSGDSFETQAQAQAADANEKQAEEWSDIDVSQSGTGDHFAKHAEETEKQSQTWSNAGTSPCSPGDVVEDQTEETSASQSSGSGDSFEKQVEETTVADAPRPSSGDASEKPVEDSYEASAETSESAIESKADGLSNGEPESVRSSGVYTSEASPEEGVHDEVSAASEKNLGTDAGEKLTNEPRAVSGTHTSDALALEAGKNEAVESESDCSNEIQTSEASPEEGTSGTHDEVSAAAAAEKNPGTNAGENLIKESYAAAVTPTTDTVEAGKSESSEKATDSAAAQTEHSKPVDSAGLESLVVASPGPIPLSGPIVYNSTHSGPMPYSGSLSLRSDSSTTSTRSFAFPILPPEWASSPVKMAPPERVYPHHHRRSWRSLCCFCSVK